jgi:hypothetical protein
MQAMQDLEQIFRERAYQLWIEGGCRHGNADAPSSNHQGS